VAILRRHWNAAKLLLALCIAQYKPEEKKLERFGNAFNDDDGEQGFMAGVVFVAYLPYR
jgi:hypothetical protein